MTASDDSTNPAERYAARVAELMRHGYGKREAEWIAEDDVYGRDYEREPEPLAAFYFSRDFD